jgi:hypothetical protein
LLEFAQQLQPSRFAEEPEELTELLQQLGARNGAGHGLLYDDARIMD